MAWVAIIGAAVAAGSAYYSSVQQRRAAGKAQDYAEEQARSATVNPKKMLKKVTKLYPAIHASMQGSYGNEFERSVRQGLSLQGELNSPTGVAISDAARSSTQISAYQKALDTALSASEKPPGAELFAKPNPGMEAGLSALRSLSTMKPKVDTQLDSSPAAYSKAFGAGYSPSQAPNGYGAFTPGATGPNGQALYNYGGGGGGGSWINSFGWIR